MGAGRRRREQRRTTSSARCPANRGRPQPSTKRTFRESDPDVTILGPEERDGARVDWRRLAPALLIGTCGGFLASIVMGGSGLLRHAITGFLGLILGGATLRALGLSLAVRNPFVAQVITATVGAGAVILVARLLA